jgi:hypothetical protein
MRTVLLRAILAIIASAALVMMTGSLMGPAFADSVKQPAIGSFQSTESFIDPGASAACGFPVTDTETDTGHFEVFFDNTGTPVRAQVEETLTGVFTANGLAVDIAGASLSIFDLNGGVTDAGINIRVSLPGGGILYIDRGRLVFDDNGNLVSEAGPHPSLHGDFDGLCAALTP